MLERKAHAQGLALLCDGHGLIQQIIYNDLTLDVAQYCGQPLTALVDSGSVEKMLTFLATLQEQRAVFDWHVFVPDGPQPLELHLYAGIVEQRMLVVGTTSQAESLQFLDALTQLNNEHLATVRHATDAMSMHLRANPDPQRNVFDEFSRINSELINTQRELASRNHELAQLAQENARLYHEAKQALRLRNEFISSITHDLRTPLTSIKGYGQILRRRVLRLKLTEPEKLLEPLTSIDATVVRMNEQIAGLLDMARIQMGGTLNLHRSKVDLVAMIQRIIKLFAPLLNQHQVEFTSAAPTLDGFWDSLYLERMLLNILANAIKYSPTGGTITLEVHLDTSVSPERAVVRICDQGVGIPAADVPHIFEPFYRAANTRERGINGTGIGLASVHQIVELHGGTITVVSQENIGTCFSVELPVAEPLAQRVHGQG